ncbi:hypothetical protein ACP6PL_13605 [Dapis sp. BLCC M126]
MGDQTPTYKNLEKVRKMRSLIMDNKIKDLESKIRKNYSLGEAIVLDYKQVGYPFYILHVDLTYLANRELQLLE